MMISRLLSHFRATRQHMALVVDEFGTVVGMVTLENVLEEIVGPMQDEFDVESPDVVPEGEGRYLVQGGAHIDEVSESLGLMIRTEKTGTVGGLLTVELGRVPQQGDRVQLDEISLEVVEARKNRATLVRITVVEGDSPVEKSGPDDAVGRD
jgi:CBS domain containing-hemolysin-like protein